MHTWIIEPEAKRKANIAEHAPSIKSRAASIPRAHNITMPPSTSHGDFPENQPGNQSAIGVSNSKELSDVHQALPESTHAERWRFLADRNGDSKSAIEKLRNYLDWRSRHCDDDVTHLDPWTYATRMALQAGNNGDSKTKSAHKADTTTKLPCTLFMLEHEQSAVSGNSNDTSVVKKKYLQHLPARIDTKLANTSVYALALAIYIDCALDRASTEKVTLVIDVRSGYGWANIKAFHLLPFIQSTVRLLCDLHPLRLERCVIFPVPTVANFLWKAVKPFLGKDTVEKVCLVSGSAGTNDGVPEKMNIYLDNDLMKKFEEKRTSCFSK